MAIRQHLRQSENRADMKCFPQGLPRTEHRPDEEVLQAGKKDRGQIKKKELNKR